MASFLLRRRYAGWLSGAGSTVSEPPASGAISASTGATDSSLMILTGLALTRLGFSPARAWNWLHHSWAHSRRVTVISAHRWPNATSETGIAMSTETGKPAMSTQWAPAGGKYITNSPPRPAATR